jgi:hypothetical protein
MLLPLLELQMLFAWLMLAVLLLLLLGELLLLWVGRDALAISRAAVAAA